MILEPFWILKVAIGNIKYKPRMSNAIDSAYKILMTLIETLSNLFSQKLLKEIVYYNCDVFYEGGQPTFNWTNVEIQWQLS